MSIRERLVASFVQFLGTEQRSDELSQDVKESLEVAIQCLESAYNISSSDARLLPKKALLEIFSDAVRDDPIIQDHGPDLPEDVKLEAESLKTQGNELMKQEKYEEALQCYTDAVKLDSKNAVFYCNRAAAYSKLNQHLFALEDCKRAIEIDPNYSKAYGRMGLAFANLNDHYQARDNYKKALELDPGNESYIRNIQTAEEHIANMEKQNPFGNAFADMFKNQQLVNMASRILQDPNMSQMLMSMMSNCGFPPGAPASGAPSTGDENTGGNRGLDSVLRASQELTSRLEQSNPEFIQDLFRRFGSMPSGNNNNAGNSGGNAGPGTA